MLRENLSKLDTPFDRLPTRSADGGHRGVSVENSCALARAIAEE
jgi:hypothetical protein